MRNMTNETASNKATNQVGERRMIVVKNLIEKGHIDIEDNINFATHADVLRLFGRDLKVIQNALVRHPQDDTLRIWFPIFYQGEDNDWENTWGVKEESLFERRKYDNESYLLEEYTATEKHTRLLFAKIAPFGKAFYKFKGSYQFDPELSRKAKKAAYRRIATTAKIYPLA